MNKNFPHGYFIAAGRGNKMFTLRQYVPKYSGPSEILNGVYQGNVEVGSEYVVNLSSDPDEAYEKALSYARKTGYPLRCGRPTSELLDIHRSTSEQVAERERLNLERLQREQALREEAHNNFLDNQIKDAEEFLRFGRMPFGAHKGKLFTCEDRTSDSIPKSYLRWLLEQVETEDRATVLTVTQDYIREHNLVDEDLDLPALDKNAFLGKLKERRVIQATVVRIASFLSDYTGRTYVYTLAAENNECVVWFSTADQDFDIGESVIVKGTVADHNTRDGQAQTRINRVKVLDEMPVAKPKRVKAARKAPAGREKGAPSKIGRAREIASAMEDPSRKNLIAAFVEQLGMTPAGASTYAQTVRKEMKKSA